MNFSRYYREAFDPNIINIYSHDKKINVFEELDAEILDSNSQQIINDILNMIEDLDPTHYNSMVDRFQDELS